MIKKLILFFTVIISVQAHAFSLSSKTPSVIYQKINPAIVSIDTHLPDGISCGTGCIIDKSGVILTSAHILEDGKDIVVTMSNGEDYKADILKKFDRGKDIALLKIAVPYELATVKMGDSAKVKVGDSVLAIGNPFGFNGTLTMGIVSRIDYFRNRIQTDAAINPGSSGGPLLNSHGEIIGINQAIYNPDNNISNVGIGFATPINIIKEYMSEDDSGGI
jgi:serine protease Do